MTPTFEQFKKGAKLFYTGASKTEYTARVESNDYGVFQVAITYVQDGRKKKQYKVFAEHNLLNYYNVCCVKLEELV